MIRKIVLPAALCLSVAACTAAQISSAAPYVSIALGLAENAVPGVAAAIQFGQLVCGDGPQIVALIDSVTGKAILATGGTAADVNAVCGLIGASWKPVAPPAPLAAIPRAVVALPKAG